ncbi:hypothetical protein NL108_016190 [Boleophthalmus pectinirostris]|nr:hypothetical protein NL108_016190 [Boleophthalmus pectinirostris]
MFLLTHNSTSVLSLLHLQNSKRSAPPRDVIKWRFPSSQLLFPSVQSRSSLFTLTSQTRKKTFGNRRRQLGFKKTPNISTFKIKSNFIYRKFFIQKHNTKSLKFVQRIFKGRQIQRHFFFQTLCMCDSTFLLHSSSVETSPPPASLL